MANIGQGTTAFTLIPIDAVISATGLQSTYVDLRTVYDGTAVVVVNANNTAGTNPTLDIKVQTCDTSGGTYADCSPAVACGQFTTGNATKTFELPVGILKGYIKAYATIGGTVSPSYKVHADVILQKKTW